MKKYEETKRQVIGTICTLWGKNFSEMKSSQKVPIDQCADKMIELINFIVLGAIPDELETDFRELTRDNDIDKVENIQIINTAKNEIITEIRQSLQERLLNEN